MELQQNIFSHCCSISCKYNVVPKSSEVSNLIEFCPILCKCDTKSSEVYINILWPMEQQQNILKAISHCLPMLYECNTVVPKSSQL